MTSKKKRYGLYLPITREQFMPIYLAIKAKKKDVGSEVLDCLSERYPAEFAYLDKRADEPNDDAPRKGKQS